MLTALTIKNITADKWYKKVINKLKGNSIDIQLNSARGVVLRHITYTIRNGKIDWGKLNHLIGNQRNHLLCSENIILPKELGFRRFDNIDFKTRLATNAAVYILSQADTKNIRVGLYDPKGEHTELLSHLVKNTANLAVITDNSTAFEYEVRSVYEELGASVRLSDNRIHLMDCQLIIAPDKIKEALPLSSSAVVLTSYPPSVCICGLVCYSYYFRMPKGFDELKPQELTEEYFCGALYTKAGQYELGSIVPLVCGNQNSTQTCMSIREYLLDLQKDDKTEEKQEVSS